MNPEPGTVWRHNISGDLYRVEFLTNLPDVAPYTKTVVFRNQRNDTLWSRAHSDWQRSFTFAETDRQGVLL